MSMNEIYSPRHPKTTQIDDKFEEFRSKVLSLYQTPVSSTHDLMQAIDFNGSPEEFGQLNASVSLDHLFHADDLRVSTFHPADISNRSKRSPSATLPQQATTLKTVEKLAALTEVYSINHCNRYSKYNKHRHIKINVDNSNPDILPTDEVLVVVRVYEPFRYKCNTNTSTHPKLKQRFTVLGSQRLTELRDRIYCQCNYGPFYDISDDPKQQLMADNKKPFDHGFFFIYDTFFNDTRQPTCDYTEPIRVWAENQGSIGEFKVESMEDTTFGQLVVQLGSACVYQHHGNCEHLFTFSDIRLIAPGDPLNRLDYPCLDLISFTKKTPCQTCAEMGATKIVCGSTVHMHDPAYLCDECFDAFHYVDGQKVGEFTAYRFAGNGDINLD